jgi:hypothetical protein
MQPVRDELIVQAKMYEDSNEPTWALVLYKASLKMLEEIFDEVEQDMGPKVHDLLNTHVDHLVSEITRLEVIVERIAHG